MRVKRSLVRTVPYQSDRAGVDFNMSHWIRLDWNEAIEPEPASVKKAIIRFTQKVGLNFYPDFEALAIRKELAAYTKTAVESVIVYNGSDSALKNIFDAFLNPGDTVLVFAPTYSQINPFIAANGGKIVQFVPKNVFDPQEWEIEAYMRQTKKHNVVYINNPNNPTGTLLSPLFIKKLCLKWPHTIFVIDEAYYEFAKGKTCVSFASQLPNIVVVRSFSKAFRLAGVRLGYSVASLVVNHEIMKIHNGKDVNAIAQIAGCAALLDIKAMRLHVKKINDAKKKLKKELERLDFEVYGGYGNFLVIKDLAYREIKTILLKHGILIRDRSTLPKMKNCVRVTISYDPRLKVIPHLLMEARHNVNKNE